MRCCKSLKNILVTMTNRSFTILSQSYRRSKEGSLSSPYKLLGDRYQSRMNDTSKRFLDVQKNIPGLFKVNLTKTQIYKSVCVKETEDSIWCFNGKAFSAEVS